MIEEVLRSPDAADRQALLEVLARAFRDNPMNVAIHGPSPEKRVRANRAGLRALVFDSRATTEMRVISYENQVVGGFIAVPPGEAPLPGPSLWRQLGCLLHQGARAMDRWGQVNRNLAAFRPARDHWYLSVLGVAPEMWGRGFGSRLIEALFDLALQQPAPVYLESDRPESVDFYRGRGFENREEIRVEEVTCWCLGRGFG